MSRGDCATSTDYSRPYRPWPVAWANRLGGLFEPLGLRAALEPSGLVAGAQRRTGLRWLGDDDLVDRLALLVDSIESEARLHPVGRVMARENLIRILVNRLRIEADIAQHPEIEALPIDPPVFVVGLQRSGTTMLHRQLACDPAFRFLASWEAVQPARPGPPAIWRRLLAPAADGYDPRPGDAAAAQRALGYLAPDFAAIHPVEATEPEEDCLLFDYGLWSTVFEATWYVPSYSAWLERQDHTPAYRGYARLLRYLQWQRPGGRWVLKTPQHLEQLDALLATFPEARILWTHRDPCRTVASFCSMMAHAWGVFSDRVDPRRVAAHWGRKACRMIERALDTRDRVGDERFLDVAYRDLVNRPERELERIYRFLDLPLTDLAAGRMRAWRGRNPQHKHGRHRYRLEDFGLDRRRVEADFAVYRRRFDIPHE